RGPFAPSRGHRPAPEARTGGPAVRRRAPPLGALPAAVRRPPRAGARGARGRAAGTDPAGTGSRCRGRFAGEGSALNVPLPPHGGPGQALSTAQYGRLALGLLGLTIY